MAIGIGASNIIGAGISAGSSILGGYMSNMYSKKAAKRAYRYQRKIMNNQIQWKVADAKKAGIHPLYAMGAPTTGFSSPISTGFDPGQGLAEAGQTIGGAVSRLGSRDDKKEMVLRNRLLEAQIGETDARKMAMQAETQRTLQSMRSQAVGSDAQLGVMDESLPLRQPAVSSAISEFDISPNASQPKDMPRFARGNFGDLPGAGLVERTPVQINTHKPGQRGIESGDSPGFKQWRLPSGLPILLPAGQTMAESLEETPFWMWPSIVQANKKKFGKQWGADFMEYLLTGGAPWHQRYAE